MELKAVADADIALSPMDLDKLLVTGNKHAVAAVECLPHKYGLQVGFVREGSMENDRLDAGRPPKLLPHGGLDVIPCLEVTAACLVGSTPTERDHFPAASHCIACLLTELRRSWRWLQLLRPLGRAVQRLLLLPGNAA